MNAQACAGASIHARTHTISLSRATLSRARAHTHTNTTHNTTHKHARAHTHTHTRATCPCASSSLSQGYGKQGRRGKRVAAMSSAPERCRLLHTRRAGSDQTRQIATYSLSSAVEQLLRAPDLRTYSRPPIIPPNPPCPYASLNSMNFLFRLSFRTLIKRLQIQFIILLSGSLFTAFDPARKKCPSQHLLSLNSPQVT
jgi:hypothetical protein